MNVDGPIEQQSKPSQLSHPILCMGGGGSGLIVRNLDPISVYRFGNEHNGESPTLSRRARRKRL